MLHVRVALILTQVERHRANRRESDASILVVSPVTRSLAWLFTAECGSLDNCIILRSSRVHGELPVRLDCAPVHLRVKVKLPVETVAAGLKGPRECVSSFKKNQKIGQLQRTLGGVSVPAGVSLGISI